MDEVKELPARLGEDQSDIAWIENCIQNNARLHLRQGILATLVTHGGAMKIWGRKTSINVQKVLWTCDELSVAYERVDVGGSFGGLSDPAYLRLNPNGLIPVLEDEGFVLWESNAIVRYLTATRRLGTLCPSLPRERADAERWMDWQLAHLLPGMSPLFMGLVRTAPEARDLAGIERALHRSEAAWRILDGALAGRAYLIGDRFTMADIALGGFAYRWYALPIERPSLSNMYSWYERLSERPAYREHVMIPLQ
jgi:glutathione S-transferase